MGSALDFLTTGNLCLGIILGASMTYLWGLIRAMQMIVLQSLLSINYPPHAAVFFQAGITFAAVDVLKGEQLYETIFVFTPTPPLTPRFDQFKMSDRNFLKNSGSYFLLQTLILLDFAGRLVLHKMLRRCASNRRVRWILMGLPKGEAKVTW